MPDSKLPCHLEAVGRVPGRARAGREQHGLAQEPPVPAPELAQQAKGDGTVVEGGRPEVVAQSRHHVRQHLCVWRFAFRVLFCFLNCVFEFCIHYCCTYFACIFVSYFSDGVLSFELVRFLLFGVHFRFFERRLDFCVRIRFSFFAFCFLFSVFRSSFISFIVPPLVW